EEVIISQGHLCDFYPKYHYELNFIDQYWGAVKLMYRMSQKTNDMKEMENYIKACLDAPCSNPTRSYRLIRYANRAAQFISAYGQGLTGPEAAWANRKYHGHRILPPDMALKLKYEHEQKYTTSIST
ncbi:hypothetical protein BYT27DRAFT_7093654, partial [Phlegmacium glaucopus]